MPNKSIGEAVGKTSNFCRNFESVTFKSIRKVLPDSVIEGVCGQAGYTYRLRRISPILTVLHMIVAAIWPEDSFVASWQLLWASFAANFTSKAGRSPSRGTVCKARKRFPLKAWNNIVTWLSEQGQAHSEKLDKCEN